MIGGIGGGGAPPDFSAIRAQMAERMNARFDKADSDQSGGLSLEEFSQGHEARLAKRAERGGNVEGAKSAEELFTQMDADEDGQVTKDEMKAHREEMRSQRGGKPKPPHGSFSPDMMNSLLSIQEQATSLLETLSKQQDEQKQAV